MFNASPPAPRPGRQGESTALTPCPSPGYGRGEIYNGWGQAYALCILSQSVSLTLRHESLEKEKEM